MADTALVKRFILILSFFFISSSAYAYNFLVTNPETGQPVAWEPGTTIEYWLDPGDLGRLSNDQVHTLLKEAMSIWENASESAAVPKFVFAGYLPEDVDSSNMQHYLDIGAICYTDDLEACESETQKNLQTVILLDDDDTILENTTCKISPCSAHAGPKVIQGSQSNPLIFRQGIVILGDYLGDSETSISAAIGTMVHELGHLLGLAHSVLNQGYDLLNDTVLNNAHVWSTMAYRSNWPAPSKDKYAATLNPDDIAGISTLYPNSNLNGTLGSISGTITNSDGTPINYLNVTARNVNDPLCEAYSFLSGRTCPDQLNIVKTCKNANGEFDINGLPPGNYTIEVEEVNENMKNRVTPGGGLLIEGILQGDAEFWNENDIAGENNTESTTISVAAGEEITGITITLSNNFTSDDWLLFIPLETFTAGNEELCLEDPPIDYAALIGIDESGQNAQSSGTGGCSLSRF